MKMRSFFLSTIFIALVMFSGCSKDKEPEFNYISANNVADIINKGDTGYVFLDIQVQSDFDKHHLKSAVSTCAYPVKTDEEKALLKKHLAAIKPEQKIIIVCPRGKGGAENSVKYLREQGIDNSRLLILENGQQGWPGNLNDLIEGK
ncbi:rhodanese-like domain-containing protein [Desulfovibrio sp. 86]|uniref:Putative lipoprotein n=1 Tax=uncultured Desulfovibrio sp. TaxID=167968 RepID=A0A212KYZ9_9BACT|nr:rhodanese-like domain-containing protein [Desulfovibrio sp. 86]SCM70486.1 putative lipoprotein [uncultured Desulfovibrio sp.]VZH32310.1 putative lipoprotein [Desulfovibrio sp. 86]